MKGWHKIIVVFAVLLTAFLCKDLLAGQEDTEKLSKAVAIEQSVTVDGVEAENPAINPEQVSVEKPTKEALNQKTKKLQMPFIANNGQVDEQVRFYAKTFGGTVFVTKDGEIVYALPHVSPEGGIQGEESGVPGSGLGDGMQAHRSRRAEDRERNAPRGVSPSRHAAWYPMGSGAAGWHGQAPLVRAVSESEMDAALVWAHGHMPFLPADGADSPPGRSFTNALLAAYIPGLQRETPHRNVSTFAPTVGNVLYDGMKNESPDQLSTQNSKLPTPNSRPRSVALKERLIGGKGNEIKGGAQSATAVSYFKGNDPSKWKSNIATYEMVDMGEVYDGICLRLKAHGDNVEKLFTVKPGADAGQIRIRLDGIKSFPVSVETHGNASLSGQQSLLEGEKQPPEAPFIKGDLTESPSEKGAMGLSINKRGELVVETELGPVKFTKPVAYQEIGGKRVEVAVEYRIQEPEVGGEEYPVAGKQVDREEPEAPNSKPETQNSKPTYGFTVASYDKTKDLIIDPLLASTFLGGSSFDTGHSLALDPSGNIYVTGEAASSFPTTSGAFDTSYNGGSHDVFVSKLDSGLTSLLASTFLGGSKGEGGNSLSLDASGNIYVTGYTQSSDFPTTRGAYDTSFNGVTQYAVDVFVSKLNSGLTSLLASTFLGEGWSSSLTLDASGNIYVTGEAASSFPTTSGAYDTSFNGTTDVFVSKLDSELTNLLASTFLGGSSWEYGTSLSLGASGNVHVTGKTFSFDFPTTKDAYNTSFNGDFDVFVSKLDSGLTSLLASTFLGGYNSDAGSSITLDASGNVYVTGKTCSSDFPTTFGAYDTYYSDMYDAFISMLDSGLTSLLASTFLGGYNEDGGSSITLDASGNVYVTGHTQSYNFPVTKGAYDTIYNGSFDVFVSKLNSTLKGLLASTFLGGSAWDSGNFLTLDTSGNVYVTGNTCSPNFPTTRGSYNTSLNGYYNFDAFVSKLDGNLSADISCIYSISPTRQSFSSSGGTSSVGVTVSSGTCSWTAVSKAAWITITSGNSGTGNGTVAYSVSANTGTSARTGTMTIAGQTFEVIEYGLACTAESITATLKKLTLRKGINDTVTITVKGYSDCPVEGVAVTAKIYGTGGWHIDVSPGSQETDANGQAIFSISAKDKKGTALLTFNANGLNKGVTARVKVR